MLKKRKLYIIIVGIIILAGLISVKSIAESQDIIDLREQREFLQNQISENSLQLDELEGQISDIMLELQDLNDRIYKHEIEVAVLDIEISELNEKISDTENKFNEAEELFNKRKNILVKRIISQYEAGDIQYLDILLGSNGLIDFISNYYMIVEIMENETRLIERYEEQKDEIAKMKEELDSYKSELKEKKENQEKSAIVLSNIRVVKNNQMSRLTDEEIELQNKIDEYQQEAQRIEVELLILLTQNLGSEYVGGTLAWPAPGYTTITYKYGMRIHPISGVHKMHAGVDIATPTGSYAIAANDGKVVRSIYSASYGNMVVIDHGGGLSTLYAHGEERLVEEGETVVRGQPVLKTGSTGISTGPHLHFEVRVNGSWTDPLEYILKNYTKDQENEEN